VTSRSITATRLIAEVVRVVKEDTHCCVSNTDEMDIDQDQDGDGEFDARTRSSITYYT
jgi:hypothetical protein